MLPMVVLRRAEGTERWMEEEDLREREWHGNTEEIGQMGRGDVVDGHYSKP